MTDLLEVLKAVVRAEEAKDSLEVGPAGSRLKVYGDFADEEGFRAKVDAALRVRAHALHRLEEGEEDR